MSMRRKIGFIAVPLAGLGILLLAVANRLETPVPKRVAPKKVRAAKPTERHTQARYRPAESPHVGPAASARQIASASEQARLRSTYRNFWTAVATQDAPLEVALHKALARDREAALRLAHDALAKSQSDFDRDVTRQTIEALRR